MSNLSGLPSYRRPTGEILATRLEEPRRFIQVLAGPRQVGKTTLVRQILAEQRAPTHYASADEPSLRSRVWLEEQWAAARILPDSDDAGNAILVLDEVQKITGWSETVKRLWDEDTASGRGPKVVLLGSAPLLVQRGLTESLAGRFEVIPLNHWAFGEMKDAFGWDLDTYIFHGGYPGAAPLIDEPERWSRYIRDSLIETTISRDVLLLTRVDKPALLRQLFALACNYSGQVVSYTKMLGQLQDAGNTTTLAHYLELLAGAGMVVGLPKYSGAAVRRRGSSPKLQVLNTGLMTAAAGLTLQDAKRDAAAWGRLVESCVGAHLINTQTRGGFRVFYWRAGSLEVDFVVETAAKGLIAIEVKSGPISRTHRGMEAFDRKYHLHQKLLVGGDGVPLEEFLLMPVDQWSRA